MSAFLFYPTLRSSGRDVRRFFFQKEESKSFDDNIFSADDPINQSFATIDDSKAVAGNLFCLASTEAGETKEFRGSDREEEAEAWIQSKWAEFSKEHYPEGLHFEKNKLYHGNMLVGELREHNGVWYSEWNEYHHSKFFWSKSYREEHGRIFFDKMSLEESKEAMIEAFDIDRYNSEKEKKREEKTQESAKTAKFLGLKELKGSPKQKAWAEKIRADFLKTATEAEIKKTKRAKTAKWWIENRNKLLN